MPTTQDYFEHSVKSCLQCVSTRFLLFPGIFYPPLCEHLSIITGKSHHSGRKAESRHSRVFIFFSSFYIISKVSLSPSHPGQATAEGEKRWERFITRAAGSLEVTREKERKRERKQMGRDSHNTHTEGSQNNAAQKRPQTAPAPAPVLGLKNCAQDQLCPHAARPSAPRWMNKWANCWKHSQ